MEKTIEHLTVVGKVYHSARLIVRGTPLLLGARRLSLSAEISDTKDVQFTWYKPDEEGLVEFLYKHKGFG